MYLFQLYIKPYFLLFLFAVLLRQIKLIFTWSRIPHKNCGDQTETEVWLLGGKRAGRRHPTAASGTSIVSPLGLSLSHLRTSSSSTGPSEHPSVRLEAQIPPIGDKIPLLTTPNRRARFACGRAPFLFQSLISRTPILTVHLWSLRSSMYGPIPLPIAMMMICSPQDSTYTFPIISRSNPVPYSYFLCC